MSNTGNVSFILYGIFILMAVVAMIAAFRIIIKGTIENEKLDKMIELFKYTIVSTAIATVTLIVTNLFKERDQDIKELEYFDKYVTDVKKVDGAERLQLAKYLSIVAPGGEMKKSWRAYYDTIAVEYKQYLKLKEEQLKNDATKNPTQNQLIKFEKIDEQIRMFEKPLAAPQIKMAVPVGIGAEKKWEEAGFSYLLAKDVNNAIAAFASSEESKNGYHQVYEIGRYLRKNKRALSDPDSSHWKTVYSDISKKYAWKMPPETKAKLVAAAQ